MKIQIPNVQSVSPSAVVLYQQLRQSDTRQGKVVGDLRIETNITHAVEKYFEARRVVLVTILADGKLGPCPDCGGATVTNAHNFCHKCGRRLQW